MARREQQRLGYREKSTSYKVAAAIRVLTTLTYVLESGGKKEGEKRKEERTAEALSPPRALFPPLVHTTQVSTACADSWAFG